MARKLSADVVEGLKKERDQLKRAEIERLDAWNTSQRLRQFRQWYHDEKIPELQASKVTITDTLYLELQQQWKESWLYETYSPLRELEIERIAEIEKSLSGQKSPVPENTPPETKKNNRTNPAKAALDSYILSLRSGGITSRLAIAKSLDQCASFHTYSWLVDWGEKLNDENFTWQKAYKNTNTKNYFKKMCNPQKQTSAL